MYWVTTQKNGASALGLQRVLERKSYKTARISRCLRTRQSRGKCNRPNSDESWLIRKSAVSTIAMSGVQPEKGAVLFAKEVHRS